MGFNIAAGLRYEVLWWKHQYGNYRILFCLCRRTGGAGTWGLFSVFTFFIGTSSWTSTLILGGSSGTLKGSTL
jgi:hypothetical protein